jgi:adenylylsulfate kinase
LREVFGNDLGHSIEDRKKSAMRNARLCKLLADQGIDVVCATISMFHDCHKWNRDNINNYKEIYIKVPFEILRQRDQKGLYSAALSKNTCNVMGIDLEIEEPHNPDITILNDGKLTPEIIVQQIINKI